MIPRHCEGWDMRNLVKIAVALIVLTLAANAADDRNSVVITFKDGHQQNFRCLRCRRSSSRPRTRQLLCPCRSPRLSAPDITWAAGGVETARVHNFIITLDRDGHATKSIGSAHGTWTVENGEAHVSWDDGWHDAIRKVGNNYEKVAYGPGKTFSDQPDNIADAKSLDPI